MFIELVDDLRCPRPHEETWLVASADRTDQRDIVEGTLGCPICHAEYPIRAGVVWFADLQTPALRPSPTPAIDPELALRLAAFLDLSGAEGFAVLAGSWGPAAPLLRDLVPTHLVVLNAAGEVATGGGVSALQIASGIPLADATCRGVALDVHHADAPHLSAAIRVLRPRGRLVAPAATPLPPGVAELARDDRLWVAERVAEPPQLVSIRARGG